MNPRKLVAIDIVFLGPKVILAEFGLGVPFCAGLGIFSLWRSHTLWQTIAGAYLVSLGVNYVPMLIYAIQMARGSSAQAELGDELNDKKRAAAKYRRQSLWLLVPLAVPLAAIASIKRDRLLK